MSTALAPSLASMKPGVRFGPRCWHALGAAALAWLLHAGAWAATEQPLVLHTPTGDIAGTLMLPSAPAPMPGQVPVQVPVALLIAGSGPTDRDGNGPVPATRNDSLRLLAQGLADAGWATLRFDKRGIAASAPAMSAEADLRFGTYVRDARDWIDLLAADARFRGVAVIGHSEGSLIGMLAARASVAKAFVSLAGVARPASQVLRQQLAGKLPPDLAAASESTLTALEAGRTVASVPAPLLSLYRPSVQPYLISWFQQVPTEALQTLKLPCLIVQGDTDIQVPVAEAQALHAARPEAALRVIEGMNHVLKSVSADRARQIASYGDPSLPLAPALMPELVRFLRAAVPER